MSSYVKKKITICLAKENVNKFVIYSSCVCFWKIIWISSGSLIYICILTYN